MLNILNDRHVLCDPRRFDSRMGSRGEDLAAGSRELQAVQSWIIKLINEWRRS